jgi:hypothetical protein
MTFLLYQIYIYLISTRFRKPTKTYLKMTIALSKSRIVSLWLFIPSHIYRELEECQAKSEDHFFMVKINIYSVMMDLDIGNCLLSRV